MSDYRNNSKVDIVEEIKSRCNIADVIGRVVTLKKAGSTLKGLCPFHKEKTPSFVVYEASQRYKCFGCNEGGDVFNFVQKYYNLDFREAVEMLAKEYGIEIPEGSFGNASNSKKNEKFYEINRQAAIFFYKAMREKENPGMPYMLRRGITRDTLDRFGIGYADGEWSSLADHLTGLGFDKEDLFQVGLLSKKENRYYDKFRDRVIFPIKNTAGKVIGFGGRIISQGEPKYLNSPESSVFLKKNNLYGLDITKKYVSSEDSIILVEGYMDVISLFQAGIRNVSASLGTALTDNQARLIKRYTPNVILSYDADNAGQTAALRGLDILYAEDCRAKVLVVNDGKDPDEFIKAKGREAFLKLAAEALPYGDFKLAKAREKYDLRDDQQRVDYSRAAISIIKGMKPVEADIYIGRLSEETGISEMALRREYEDAVNKAGGPAFAPAKADDVPSEMTEGEQELLKLMLIDHDYTAIPEDIKDSVFRDPVGESIYRAILEVDNGERPLDMKAINDRLDINASEMLKSVTARIIQADKEEKIFSDCISYIRLQKLRREDEEISEILSKAGNDTDPEELNRLMQRRMEIQKQIKG
ncbi:MAG: DNA primase [Clostridia bacterium]|nr:DNA primase [Clostridia bacterium]